MSFFRIEGFKAIGNDYFKNVFFSPGLYSLVAPPYAFTILFIREVHNKVRETFCFPRKRILFFWSVGNSWIFYIYYLNNWKRAAYEIILWEFIVICYSTSYIESNSLDFAFSSQWRKFVFKKLTTRKARFITFIGMSIYSLTDTLHHKTQMDSWTKR